jgi:hypothetical protein
MTRLLARAALCLTFLAGCTTPSIDFAGKTCEAASDCPETYACVATDGGPGGTCELLGAPDAGEGGDGDAGPVVVPTYCDDIGPILAASCVSTCHGAVQTGSGQTSFRLDYYEPDAGGLPGAKAKAARIKVRTSDQTMPPPGSPAPTAAERALLARWVEGGAPFCSDAGVDGGG